MPGLPVDGVDVMEISSQPLMSVNVSFPLIDSLTSVVDKVKGIATMGLGGQMPKLSGSPKQAAPSYGVSSRMRMAGNSSVVAKNDSHPVTVAAASGDALLESQQDGRSAQQVTGKAAAASPGGVLPGAGAQLSKVSAAATGSKQAGVTAAATASNTQTAAPPAAAAPAMPKANPPMKLIKTEPVSMKIMPAPTTATASIPPPAQTPKAATPAPAAVPQQQSGSPNPQQQWQQQQTCLLQQTYLLQLRQL